MVKPWWAGCVVAVAALVMPADAFGVEHTWFVGRGFDVGLWGTGVHAVPDLTNPRERAFSSIIRSPTTQGIGRIYYSASGLGGGRLKLTVDFNTYRWGSYLTMQNVGARGVSATVYSRAEWLLTGLLVHHMKRGDNVRELGFIAYFVGAGTRWAWTMADHLSVEADIFSRTWMFHRGLRTDPGFVMPPSFQSLEPRVRVRWADVITAQDSLGLPRGLHVVGEVGVDFRHGSRAWGGVNTPNSPRNNVGPGKFPRRLSGRGTWGQPLLGERAWISLAGEAAYGWDEDDLTRTRVGGMNPATVALPGAAWGEYFCERFALTHLELGLFATRFLYTGISVHGGIINDQFRDGRLDEFAPVSGIASETRIGLGRLGFVRFRVGGSPQVVRKKTQGSLGFLFWWEVGNLPDRTMLSGG